MHTPVLLDEVVEVLDPKPGEHFIDCTFGGGGHTAALLERTAPDGTVLAIDHDKEAFGRAPTDTERVVPAIGNFRDLKDLYEQNFRVPVSGILFDLGISSYQLEEDGYGISFQKDEPLLMRMDRDGDGLTAATIVNKWSREDIAKMLRKYGEEKEYKAIADAIVRERRQSPITTTTHLADLITKTKKTPRSLRRADPSSHGGKKRGIHPATKTFQALRIAVNDELESIKEALAAAVTLVQPGGHIAVISFHSLEDRIVKRFVQHYTAGASATKSGEKQVPLQEWKQPIVPTQEEIKRNPRARSAKLRIISIPV